MSNKDDKLQIISLNLNKEYKIQQGYICKKYNKISRIMRIAKQQKVMNCNKNKKNYKTCKKYKQKI